MNAHQGHQTLIYENPNLGGKMTLHCTSDGLLKESVFEKEQLGDSEFELSVWNQLADAQVDAGDFQEAQENYERSFSVLKREASQHIEYSTKTLCMLCLLNISFGSWDRALEALDNLESSLILVTDAKELKYLNRRCKIFKEEIRKKSSTRSKKFLEAKFIEGVKERFKKSKKLGVIDLVKQKCRRLQKHFKKNRECRVCHKKTGKLSACGRCKAIFYCSRAHQRADWHRHKYECSGESARGT